MNRFEDQAVKASLELDDDLRTAGDKLRSDLDKAKQETQRRQDASNEAFRDSFRRMR